VSPAGPPDRDLVEAFLERRDGRAFDALYDRHTPRLYRLALRLTGGDDATAQDLVHDTWVRSAAKLGQFGWRAQLATWLGGILVNRHREWLRGTRHEAELPDGEAWAGADDRRLTSAVDRVALERAIAGLPPGSRSVLVLHDVEGYTHEEIGALLSIEPGTSKSQLSRARSQLRRALGGPR
jgi:RNA polymerase sigma-70 factor (ECF subfamily)